MLTIRKEIPEDALAIRYVNEQAFGSADEADLIEKLRLRQGFILSLVASQDEQIVGHILFSPITIESEYSVLSAVALGPMAVLPAYQRRGIGSQLVHAGLAELRQANHEIVVLLGHPNYYPRFGFSPAKSYGIRCEYDVPDELFMVLELRKGALAGRGGTVKYQPEFQDAE